MDLILAHGGRITWDEVLIIAALAVPLLIGISYLISRAIRSNR